MSRPVASPTETLLLRGARWSALFLLLLTVLATMSVLGSGAPLLARSLIVLLVWCYAAWSLHRLLRPRWIAVVLNADGLELIGSTGQRHRLSKLAPRFVCPWFIGIGGTGRVLGLFREQMEREDFRRLSVYLRQGPP